MRYLPILEELCSSDSILFMVAGVIVALVISVKFCDTNYMLEIALLFVGTLALGAFIGFLIGLIVTIVSGKGLLLWK